MRRLHLLMIIWISACGAVFTEARAQPIIKFFSRSSIEVCPEEKKRPVLQFLDEARALADSSVRLLAEGRSKELYDVMSTSFKKGNTEASFREFLAALERREGKVLEYEYRDQSLMDVYGNPWEIDPQKDFSIVRYSIKTTTNGGGLVLQVRTRRQGIEPVVERIDMSHDVSPATSAKRPETQSPREAVCPIIRDSLD